MKRVLITGARRSGTTFLGKVLGASKSHGYIFEPLNGDNGIRGLDKSEWYPCYETNTISESSYDVLKRMFVDVRGQYKASIGDGKVGHIKRDVGRWTLLHNLVTNQYPEPLPKRLAKFLFKNRGQYELYRFNLRRLIRKPSAVFFKDPLSALSSELLAKEFDLQVVVTIRHPAAYYYSMKKQRWGLNPSTQFLTQPEIAGRMPELTTWCDELAKEATDNAIAEYLVVYTRLIELCRRYPEQFLLVRHEDLCEEPVATMESIMRWLELPLDRQTRDYLMANTSQDNHCDSNVVSNTKRNAKQLATLWSSKLSCQEVERIRQFTFPLVEKYYPTEVWQMR